MSVGNKRDKNTYVFGSWYGEKFADNPKYLYLYYLKSGKKAYWFTKNKEIYSDLKQKGFPVILKGTKEEERISKKAKYFFYCCSLDDVNKYYAGGAIMVNLWHGIPLKKIMYDDTYNYNVNDKPLYNKLAEFVMNQIFSKTYIISTSSTMSHIYKSAFNTDSNHILNLGQPRNDCFFDASLSHQKYSDYNYDFLITYMPTMRNMGKDPIELNIVMDLDRINSLCKEYNALFMIKKHFCHRNEFTDLKEYSNIVDYTLTAVDTQELLFNTDFLITDYSSCYIDYMLLNRPIIFYPYDFEDYLSKDREMYFPYDDVTPGEIAHTFDELVIQLKKCLCGETQISEKYYRIKNLFYDLDNQNTVSSKIMNAVDKLG